MISILDAYFNFGIPKCGQCCVAMKLCYLDRLDRRVSAGYNAQTILSIDFFSYRFWLPLFLILWEEKLNLPLSVTEGEGQKCTPLN